jgi:hypothetical protein
VTVVVATLPGDKPSLAWAIGGGSEAPTSVAIFHDRWG